jgi:hypothetical protein
VPSSQKLEENQSKGTRWKGKGGRRDKLVVCLKRRLNCNSIRVGRCADDKHEGKTSPYTAATKRLEEDKRQVFQ